KYHATALDVSQQLTGALGSRERCRIRRRRDRIEIAHQRTQVGVFPFLDTPVRKAARIELTERALAQRRNCSPARQRAAGRCKGRAECLLGGGFHGPDFGIHGVRAASPANCAYPLASSSSASSFPPDFTTLPLAITCTTSGTIKLSSR